RRSDLHLFGRRARSRCASHAKPDRRDPQFANHGLCAGDGSSRFFRSSRLATSRSPRRRLPLRSRTCSADPSGRPPRSPAAQPNRNQKSETRGANEHGRAPAAKGGFGRPLRWSGPNPGALRRLCPGPARALRGSRFRTRLPNQKDQEQTMEQTIELRIVDPKTLNYSDKRDPRQVPADRLSDAALKANSNAIGFVQPPLFSEEEDGTLTSIAGRRRIKSASANKLKEMAILVKPADPLDDMRAVAENVVRAPMSPIDLWRSIEDLASKNWTEEAIATAFAVPLRQVRKLRLLGSIHPAILEHMGRGDMPEERYLRTIASAPLSEQAAVWTKQKPKKGQTATWYAIANSLMKRQMFARNAKFGEKEQAAFGIVWTEDLFAPADEDSRYATDVDAFLGAQLAWLEANVPKNGEIVQVDEYGAARLPKGATRVWGGKPGKKDRVALSVDPRNGAVSEVYFTPPAPAAKASKTGAGAGDDAPAAEPRTRPDITQKGREMIGEMRTEALIKALGREGLTSETLIGLLVLALAADNVSIRTHESAPIQSMAGVIAEGGKLTSDTALIQTTAIKVLQTVLSCRLA